MRAIHNFETELWIALFLCVAALMFGGMPMWRAWRGMVKTRTRGADLALSLLILFVLNATMTVCFLIRINTDTTQIPTWVDEGLLYMVGANFSAIGLIFLVLGIRSQRGVL